MSVREFIGARYVPIIVGDWDKTHTYEPLMVVTYQGASYTSRQYVPAGIEITNESYWVLSANYNAQIEAYRQEVRDILPYDETPTEGSTKGVTSDGIKKAIAVEATRATAAEQANATAIANEVTRARSAEEVNATAIANLNDSYNRNINIFRIFDTINDLINTNEPLPIGAYVKTMHYRKDDTGSATYLISANGTGDNISSFKIGDKYANYVVEDFVKPASLNNDLQAAINIANGKPIIITENITINSNVTISTAGQQIYGAKGTITFNNASLIIDNVDNVLLYNLDMFDANHTATAIQIIGANNAAAYRESIIKCRFENFNRCVYLDYVFNTTICNCWMLNCTYGIYVNNQAVELRIINVQANNDNTVQPSYGIYIKGIQSEGLIVNSSSFVNYDYGMYAETAILYMSVINTEFDNISTKAVYLPISTFKYTFTNCWFSYSSNKEDLASNEIFTDIYTTGVTENQQVVFDNCTFVTNKTGKTAVGSTSPANVHNVHFVSCFFVGTWTYGINEANARNVIVQNCVFSSNMVASFYINGRGCALINNDVQSAGSFITNDLPCVIIDKEYPPANVTVTGTYMKLSSSS